MGRPFALTADQQQIAIGLYKDGWTLARCAEIFGCAESTIMLVLKRAGVPRRDRVKRCFVNVDYFAEINSEETAYWLGFLTADGHVKPGWVALQLQLRDIAHVRAFAAATASTYAIWQNAVACSTTICSRPFAAHLIKLGLNRQKSRTARPVKLPQPLRRHYWRGLIDGDGCVWKDNCWGVRLGGTLAIARGFSDEIKRTLHIAPRKVRSQSSIFLATYKGKDALRILSWETPQSACGEKPKRPKRPPSIVCQRCRSRCCRRTST